MQEEMCVGDAVNVEGVGIFFYEGKIQIIVNGGGVEGEIPG